MIAELVAISLALPDGGAVRSQGIHVSSVIRCIAAESGILKKEWVESLELVDLNQANWWEGLDIHSQLRIAIGMAWDHWYLNQLEGVTPHPGEMEMDGIYMTPDGESLDMLHIGPRYKGLVLCIHEVKATYKSVRTVGDLFTQWMWVTQVKAYCKAANTTVAYVHVLFLCGDYKYPIRPQLKVWRVTFTQEEIDDSWDLITGYVRHRLYLEREQDEGLE